VNGLGAHNRGSSVVSNVVLRETVSSTEAVDLDKLVSEENQNGTASSTLRRFALLSSVGEETVVATKSGKKYPWLSGHLNFRFTHFGHPTVYNFTSDISKSSKNIRE
jgi:hypothetical protein